MNFKRKHFAIFAVALMLVVAGCAESQSDQQAEELGDQTGNDISNVTAGASYQYEVAVTEKNQISLVRSQPPFQMESSLERQNLINRYKYLNDENNVHHVYAVANDGTIIGYWVAQGKVSSVNSKLTNNRQIVKAPQMDDGTWDYDGLFKVESPQMDGSYGTNGDAIFFFTTSGNYVEYNGEYVVSEEPMNIQTPISLEREVESDSGGSSNNSTE